MMLKAELERNSKENQLKILVEVAKLINSTHDVDKILEQVVDAVIKQLGYDLCSVLLKENDFIIVKAAYGINKSKWGKIKIKIGQGVTGEVARTMKAEIINDVTKDKRYIDFSDGPKCMSELAVPIRTHDELIGVFNLEDRRKNAFTEDDLKIIQILADNVAIAIRNAKLLENLRNTNENLSLLYKTSNIINSTLDLDSVFNIIVDIFVKKLNYDNFSILLAEGKHLVLKRSHKHPKSKKKNYFVKIGHGITGTVAKTGKALIVNDVTKDKRYVAVRRGIKSELAVPIKIGERIIGVFNVESKKINAFNDYDLFLISALADQASIAIQNAETNKSLIQLNQRLNTINDLGKVINSSLDLDAVFNKMLEFMSKELHYNFCAVLMIENNRLYSRAGIGFTKKEIETYSANIGEGICGMVAKTGKPILTNDVSKIPYYKNQASLTKSELCVPLKVENRVIGVLNVESKKTNAFENKDIVYLSALADIASVAIKNAQLYNKVKDFNAELKIQVEMATQELTEANKELKRLNEIKSDFVSTVSHELRTPLTSIQGYVSLMQDGDAGQINDDQKEFLGIVKEESQRLLRLISDLLDISKIEAGKMKIMFEDFNILEFIDNYKTEILAMAAPKKIKVQIQASKGLPVIKADSDKIKQIFYNLISNAVKFSREGSLVNISIKDKNDHMQIDVSDQGIGIAEKDLKTIFEKFQQVDTKMTRKVGGTGLGLAITKNLVEAHGGNIWVKSKIGKGSEFSFTVRK